jgi:long-chain acyl-CoA synthetase
VLVYGDKRPYCVALVTPSEVALKQHGPDAASSPELKAAIQTALDGMNARLASFETVKRFAILPGELTEAAGELTPKMSVKRKVVVEKYRALIDGLYAGPAPGGD